MDIHLEQIDDNRWRIPRFGGMRVDGVVYADAKMIRDIRQDQSLVQVANVAHLPGIVGASLAMPDIHPEEAEAAFSTSRMISTGADTAGSVSVALPN